MKLKLPIFNVPYHQKLLGEECDAYMGLADFHQYHPSKQAIQEADLVLMIGGRLDNQMNFGNPPFFPKHQKLVCINGSYEELEYNRAADYSLLSDPGAFLENVLSLNLAWSEWFELQKVRRGKWVDSWEDHLVEEAKKRGIKFIMDQIVNHCGLNHWWMEDLPFKDWINYQDEFLSGKPTKYSNHRRTINQDNYASEIDKKEMTDGWFVETMPDLNNKNQFMAKFIIQNSIWWVEELGLGGIRQDTYPYADKTFLSNWAGAIMNLSLIHI